MENVIARLKSEIAKAEADVESNRKKYNAAVKALQEKLKDVACEFAKAKIGVSDSSWLFVVTCPQAYISVDYFGLISGQFSTGSGWQNLEGTVENVKYADNIVAALKKCIEEFEWEEAE